MPRLRSMPLACWGNHPVVPARAARPERRRDLDAIVGDPSIGTLISRGLGRSYGDAALPPEPREGSAAILHERLDRLLSFEPASGMLHAEAGATLAGIIEAFLPRGFLPAVTPGTKFVTLGGAIAADVHGKNHHTEGSFGAFVHEITLLLPSGEVLRCSRAENTDAFWATLGGMGLTGHILSARIRLRPVQSAFLTVRYQRARSIYEAFDLFAGPFSTFRYSVAWIDCLSEGAALGRSVLMGGDHTPAAEVPSPQRSRLLAPNVPRGFRVPFFAPSALLNPWTIRAFNALYFNAHWTRTRTVGYDSFFYPLDHIRDWNRLYGRRGFQQFQFVLPHEFARDGMVEVLTGLARSKRASFLAVLKTFGPSSGGVLSFPKPGWTLSLDLPHDGGLNAFLRGLDDLIVKHGGRRYLAKDACLSPGHFRRMYPELDRFREIRARLDPHDRLASALSRRLGITP
ncbi:MAG: FAD-binding oxidoreductase [Phycisphaerae bacterium]|nr:FAD-binding oxidoreductase [Phycisphaerae bacterium]